MPHNIAIAQARVVLEDPHACTDSSDVLCVFGALFDTLVRRDDAGRYAPALATSWIVSDDARCFTFSLRDNIRFHNGDICDAEAVRFTLERMARPDMGATLGAAGVYAQYLAGLRVEILERLKVRVTLAEPLADLFDILVAGHIVSPRAIGEAGDDLAARAVGTGPYRLEEYLPGEQISVRVNPEHYAGALAYQGISWMRGETAAARVAMLRSGAADIATGLGNAEERELGALSGFTSVNYLVPTAIILMFNALRGVGADPRVRRALNLGIDREALVRDVLYGAGQPLHGFISPIHFGTSRDAPQFRTDITEARRLLAEAGYGDGVMLDVYCPTKLPDEAQRLVRQIEAQLSGLGVRFNVHLEADRAKYANRVRLKEIHDLCVFDSSPMSAFRVLHEKIDSRVRGSWWEGYANPVIEALIDRARRSTDDAARETLYRECYLLLQRDPPWIYLYNHRLAIGLRGEHPAWDMRRDGILDVRRLPSGLKQ